MACLAVALSACGGGGRRNPNTDGGATGPGAHAEPGTYDLAGAVHGAVEAGVSISLEGALTASTTTDADGAYSFSGLPDGTYTIRPSKEGFAFDPTSLSVTIDGGDVSGENFTAGALEPTTYGISGTVSGDVTAGVSIQVSGDQEAGSASATTTTDPEGRYTFTGLKNGTYTLTPTKEGFTFRPADLRVIVSGADVVRQDFTAARVDKGPPDAGTDGGTNGTDGGTNGTDGGTNGTDGGTNDTDGGTNGTDGGTDLACEAPPEPGRPISYTSAVLGLGGGCDFGVSDGFGNLALHMGEPNKGVEVDFVTPEGNLAGSGSGDRLKLLEQASGFTGIDVYGAGVEYDVTSFSPAGSRRSTEDQLGTAWEANDPTGGLVVFAEVASSLTAYRASLEVRWRQEIPVQRGQLLALGVDRSGNVLVVFDGAELFGQGSVAGLWATHGGSLSAPFVLATGISLPATMGYSLWPRVGSGFFVRTHECRSGCGPYEWAFSIDPLATSWTAAPSWLASRPDTLLHMVRGGRAYGVLPEAGRSSAPDCEQTVEVVSPDGKSCGSATFSVASGTSCSTGPIEIGYDGTVIQTLPYALQACDALGHCSCTWQWWPGFFK